MYKLSEVKEFFQNRKVEVVTYVDRISIYVDTLTSRESLLFIQEWNSNNCICYQGLPHHFSFNKKVELYQVSDDQLMQVLQMIKGDYIISYIELAIDFRTSNKSELKRLHKFFNKSLALIPAKKVPFFKEYEGTNYYTDRKYNYQLVMYSDKDQRKHDSLSSLHIEYRISGIKNIKDLGIYLIDDVVNFNHDTFWEQRLKIYKPVYTEIGKMLSASKTLSAEGYRKKGISHWKQISILQMALNSESLVKTGLQRITTIGAIEKFYCEIANAKKLRRL